MSAQTRIYVVTGNGASHLVRAANKAQAVRHVARAYTCEVATQDDLIAHVSKGVKVETAEKEGK